MGRLRAATKDLQGISLFMQSVQDLQIDTRVSRTQYQYVLEDTNSEELAQWTPKLLDELKKSPALSDVASDQQSQVQKVVVDIDRDKESRFVVQTHPVATVLYDRLGERP